MQSVVSLGSESTHGDDAANTLTRAMAVVMVLPVIEHGDTVVGMLVHEAIGPFPQGGLNEALSLAVCLGSIGASEPGREPEAMHRCTKGPGTDG